MQPSYLLERWEEAEEDGEDDEAALASGTITEKAAAAAAAASGTSGALPSHRAPAATRFALVDGFHRLMEAAVRGYDGDVALTVLPRRAA